MINARTFRRQALYLRYLAAPRSVLGAYEVAGRLSAEDVFLLARDPWYHDFEPLGFKTPQREGMFGPNQAAKQRVLFPMLERAIGMCPGSSRRGIELFCADGFYSHYALTRGAQHVLGIDLDEHNLSKARLIGRVLGTQDRARFERGNVLEFEGTFDFAICAGGLYHISDPAGLLRRLRERVRSALVIQTVFSLARTDAGYFETPAPGWTWGCRFSYEYLTDMVTRCGWTFVERSTNELTGNARPEDRGSAYLLCVPSKE